MMEAPPVPLDALPRTELPPEASPADRAFVELEQRVVHQLFSFSPASAVQLGLHAYDGRVPDYSPAAVARYRQGLDALDRELEAISERELSSSARVDRELLKLQIASEQFNLDELKVLERFPHAYVDGLQLVPYMARAYAPAETRAAAMVQVLRAVPSVLGEARRRLKDPLGAPLVQVSQAMAAGLAPHYLDAEHWIAREAPGSLTEYRRAREAAEAEVRRFEERLEDARRHATDAFALGPARFQRLLYVREGLELPWEELRRIGEEDLHRNQSRLAGISHSLRPPREPGAAIAELWGDHPTAEGLLSEAEAYTEELRRFVREKGFVSLPTPEHCRVEETPPVSRAWTTASLDPPGPFEREAYEGVYHVTPVEPNWDPKRQREWLESFNRPLLRNITAHEVYPGHYLQLLHFRRQARSLTRRTYLSAAFVEGWAHYSELLVIEEGYGGGAPPAELAQLHDALLRDCRLLASIDMHCRGRSVAEATALFENQAHMGHFPAEREALRGTFNPEYFCYTLGKLEIIRARERYRVGHPGCTPREFHDRLLSLGAPPVGWIDRLLAA